MESNQEDGSKLEHNTVVSSDDDITAGDDDSTSGTPRKQRERQDSSRIEYKKSLRLSSDQIVISMSLCWSIEAFAVSVHTEYFHTF